MMVCYSDSEMMALLLGIRYDGILFHLDYNNLLIEKRNLHADLN